VPIRSSAARASGRSPLLRVDVVLFTARDGALHVLLVATGSPTPRDRWTLPSGAIRRGESIDDTALRIARDALGTAPTHLDQAGMRGGARRTAQPVVTVAYSGLAPVGTPARAGASWLPLSEAGALAIRDRDEIDRSIAAIRARIDHQPIAFRLLPDVFTLSELQAVYEILLGRPLHKASFRRSLHAAAIVEATDEWRTERRGRPAQLFRYAPPRRRRHRRGVRFDLLG
jgi:ADP-ribose pyrophosphatase YjhB (NUDIX family)